MVEKVPEIRVELQPSRIHDGGVGVFAVRRIEKGQKVADGVAEEDFQDLVSWDCFPRLNEEVRRKIMAFCIGTPEGFLPPPEFDFNRLTIEWFLNHSCDGNCGFDDHGDFIAIRNVQKNEELSYDYALVESNPNFSMPCNCGSKTCRRFVTGNDWKDEKFFLKNRDFMHPRLRRLLPIPA